jgi:hypothetical protein
MTSRCDGSIFAGMQDIQPSLAEIAALVGNPARANMLTALLDGRALSASELAMPGASRRRPRAGISPSSMKAGSSPWQSKAGTPITGLPRR